jgi:hypothetical protein
MSSAPCAPGDHVQKREVVIGRVDGEEGVGAETLVVNRGPVLVPLEEPTHLGLEPYGPLERLHGAPTPRIRVQVVHEVAGADHQDSLVAQRRELPAELIVERRRLRFVDT